MEMVQAFDNLVKKVLGGLYLMSPTEAHQHLLLLERELLTALEETKSACVVHRIALVKADAEELAQRQTYDAVLQQQAETRCTALGQLEAAVRLFSAAAVSDEEHAAVQELRTTVESIAAKLAQDEAKVKAEYADSLATLASLRAQRLELLDKQSKTQAGLTGLLKTVEKERKIFRVRYAQELASSEN